MAKFDEKATEKFWSNRIKTTDPLSAVLTYNAPDEINRAYDNWERGALLKQTGENLTKINALDIGSGIGRISLFLAKLGAEVTAVDISPEMLSHLTKSAVKLNVRQRVHTIISASHQIQKSGEKYDIITCFGLLEHLPPTERRMTMERIFDLSDSKTKTYMVVNNKDCLFLKNHKPKTDFKGYHNYLVGIDWLKRICSKNKFKINIRSANPNYSYLHYYILNEIGKSRLNKSVLKEMAEIAVYSDLNNNLDKDLSKKMASHFLVELSA